MQVEFPESFLPRRVSRAADREMQEVLAEDWALRTYGIAPTMRSVNNAGRRRAGK